MRSHIIPGLCLQEDGYKAIWKGIFKLPCREVGPPTPHDDEKDSDQQVVNKELSLPGLISNVFEFVPVNPPVLLAHPSHINFRKCCLTTYLPT